MRRPDPDRLRTLLSAASDRPNKPPHAPEVRVPGTRVLDRRRRSTSAELRGRLARVRGRVAPMIIGANTNVRHRGVTFHVQTEDSGRANPHVISHLYHHGTILASEKTEYG